jgi:hypothetical protein
MLHLAVWSVSKLAVPLKNLFETRPLHGHITRKRCQNRYRPTLRVRRALQCSPYIVSSSILHCVICLQCICPKTTYQITSKSLTETRCQPAHPTTLPEQSYFRHRIETQPNVVSLLQVAIEHYSIIPGQVYSHYFRRPTNVALYVSCQHKLFYIRI